MSFLVHQTSCRECGNIAFILHHYRSSNMLPRAVSPVHQRHVRLLVPARQELALLQLLLMILAMMLLQSLL
jgi:hypothetical protein